MYVVSSCGGMVQRAVKQIVNIASAMGKIRLYQVNCLMILSLMIVQAKTVHGKV